MEEQLVAASFFWHDYETWGSNPFLDRPAQFAGVRTDLDFNILGDPLMLYCKPADDFLPDPEACLITGLSPQQATNEGLVETDFISRIQEEMTQPGTCSLGYNTIRFDDEITRHTLYRNFFDPYEREWKNGNSRWDLIDVIRLSYALRPEGIEWPINDDGTPSFRLELLTQANGLAHEAAHDAMSDVYATISLARLIKEKQPKLYEYAFLNRTKKALSSLIDIENSKPLFHVSSKFPARLGCCAVVLPLARHPVNPNGIIVYDLRVDPSSWLDLSVDEIRSRIFISNDELEGAERIPLKVVHLNKCPIIVETKILKSVDPERLSRFELDGEILRKHLGTIKRDLGVRDKVAQVFNNLDQVSEAEAKNPDTQLYTGGFFSDTDKKKMEFVRQQTPDILAELDMQFDDSRISEMLFRYRARNYPSSLSETEMERWERLRYHKLTEGDGKSFTFNRYFEKLQEISKQENISPSKLALLQDLQLYGESVIPYI